ncbi:hypothetical protein HK099_002684, partial [Clydaea vesicula]
HGETEANANKILQGSGIDQPLSEKGKKQAFALKNRLKNIEFDLIITSDSKRARETAIIATENHNKQNLTFLEFHDLREISWGDWDGKSESEIGIQLGNILKRWNLGYFDEACPNGESPFDVEVRSVNKLLDILKREEKNILIVVHGRLLRIMLASILNQNLLTMSYFTHHNTTVNIIDCIISKNKPFKKLNSSNISTYTEKNNISTFNKELDNLDDNLEISSRTSGDNNHNEVDQIDFSTNCEKTKIKFEENIEFIPIILDDYSHLNFDPELKPAVLMTK